MHEGSYFDDFEPGIRKAIYQIHSFFDRQDAFFILQSIAWTDFTNRDASREINTLPPYLMNPGIHVMSCGKNIRIRISTALMNMKGIIS